MGTSFGRAEQWARPRVTLIRDVPVASFRSSPSPPPPEVTTSGAVRHQLAGFDEAHCHTDPREGRSRSRLSESARPRQAPKNRQERTVRLDRTEGPHFNPTSTGQPLRTLKLLRD